MLNLLVLKNMTVKVCVGQTEELAQIRQSCENWHIASAWSSVLWRFSCNHQNLNVESAFSQKALKGRIDLAVQRCSRRKRGETREGRTEGVHVMSVCPCRIQPGLSYGFLLLYLVVTFSPSVYRFALHTKKGSVYGDGSSVQ